MLMQLHAVWCRECSEIRLMRTHSIVGVSQSWGVFLDTYLGTLIDPRSSLHYAMRTPTYVTRHDTQMGISNNRHNLKLPPQPSQSHPPNRQQSTGSTSLLMLSTVPAANWTAACTRQHHSFIVAAGSWDYWSGGGAVAVVILGWLHSFCALVIKRRGIEAILSWCGCNFGRTSFSALWQS